MKYSRAAFAFGAMFVALSAFAVGMPSFAAERKAGEWRPKERWRGFNLLGMFDVGRVGNDARVSGCFPERHFRWMRQWGFNFARLPLDYRFFVRDGDWNRIDTNAFAKLDAALALGRTYGIHVQINFHRAPGYCVNAPAEPKNLFVDPEPRAAFMNLWAELARRYRSVPNDDLTFDLYNEPAFVSKDVGAERSAHVDVVRALLAAIRKVDAERFVFIDGWDYGMRPFPEFFSSPNVGQSVHNYQPYTVSHFGISWLKDKTPPAWPPDPGKAGSGRDFLLRRAFSQWDEAQQKGVFLMLGEFGYYQHTPPSVGMVWLEDNLKICRERGWGWALWNLDGAFGLIDSDHVGVDFEDFEGHRLDRKLLELLKRY